MADLEAKHFTVRENGDNGKILVASDFIAEDWLEAFKAGEELSLQARKSRVSANHKHFFGVLRVAREHLEAYQDDESLLDAAKIAVGHVRSVQIATAPNNEAEKIANDLERLLDSQRAPNVVSAITAAVALIRSEQKIAFIPKSINWDTMPEDEFRRFKNRALYVLTELLGTDAVALVEAEWKHKQELRARNRRSV